VAGLLYRHRLPLDGTLAPRIEASKSKKAGANSGLFLNFSVPELGRSCVATPSALLAVFLLIGVILEFVIDVTQYLELLQCSMRK
jgi:hypothetical protein